MRAVLVSLVLVFSTAVHAAGADDVARLKARIQQRLPHITITDVRPSPVPGIYEVVSGPQIAYVTADGRYLFAGDLIDLRAKTNLTATARGRATLAAIDAIGNANMLIVGAKSPTHTITVFTDVDCPYCARLHKEVPALARHGVQVRYLFFPRAGLDSESYRRAEAVWCAKDRARAMDAAIDGGALTMKRCANPVAEHYRLAQSMQIAGTPAIVLENGDIVPGYVPAAQLLKLIDQPSLASQYQGER